MPGSVGQHGHKKEGLKERQWLETEHMRLHAS